MQDRGIPLAALLSATTRLLPQFFALAAAIGLACLVLYLWGGNQKLLWLIVVLLYALAFFAAPIASSSVRSQRRLTWSSRSGAKILAFCFAWSGSIAALFIATLHIGQGMDTSAGEYLATIAVGGIIGSVVAFIPSGR